MQAPTPPKLTTQRMEVILAQHFGIRETIVVPNVSWGLINHEADLLVLKPSGWAEEVEIKISRSDLRRDLKKNRGRGHMSSDLIWKLWFAVPAEMATMPEIPAHAGILSVQYSKWGTWIVDVVRAPKINKRARKLTDGDTRRLMRLGMFRIWTLKEKLLKLRDASDKLREQGEGACPGKKPSSGTPTV